MVEEGGEGVVILLAEGIVFVIVAAAAVEGEAHPDGADGFGHVEDVVDAVFFGDGSAFAVDGVVAEEAGSEFLLVGGVGEKVAGDLPDGEVVVGKVAVDGIDDPVAPGPHAAFGVALEAVGVGVAGGIEPWPGKAFAKGGIGEEGIDEFFPRVGRGVGEESFDLIGGWREASEIEGKAADEGFFFRERRELEAEGFELIEDEGIDGMRGEVGERGFFDWNEGPVFLVLGAFLNPLADELFFFFVEFEVMVGGRHDFIRVFGSDALPNEGFFGISGDDSRPGFSTCEGSFFGV